MPLQLRVSSDVLYSTVILLYHKSGGTVQWHQVQAASCGGRRGGKVETVRAAACAVQKLSVSSPPPSSSPLFSRCRLSRSGETCVRVERVLSRGERRDKLFCSLTCHIVNKSKSSVEKHMLGKKYRKAQGAPLFCCAPFVLLWPTPTLASCFALPCTPLGFLCFAQLSAPLLRLPAFYRPLLNLGLSYLAWPCTHPWHLLLCSVLHPILTTCYAQSCTRAESMT